jgi:hypothetical protein
MPDVRTGKPAVDIGTYFTNLWHLVEALWAFGGEWRAVFTAAISGALVVVFLAGAHFLRDRSGWLSAILGMMGATVVMWWVFGIIPSAWVYFADSAQDLLLIPGLDSPNWEPTGILPESFSPVIGNLRFNLAPDFYLLFRDSIVVIETAIATVGLVLVALAVQRRYPRALAEGEEARPQSGGYK